VTRVPVDGSFSGSGGSQAEQPFPRRHRSLSLSLSLSLSRTSSVALLVLLHLVFLNPNPTKLLPSPSLFPATAIVATGIQNFGSCRKHHLDSLSSMSLSVCHQPMTLAQGV
jgi:hypothetical protein